MEAELYAGPPMESVTETASPLDELTAEATPWSAPVGGEWVNRARLAWQRIRFPVLVYLGSRLLLIVVAIVDGALRRHALLNELANWDGFWYRWIANHGYPTHVLHTQTRLGFFPLYPLVTWLVGRPVHWLTGHSAVWSVTAAGVLVAGVGGLVATVLVQRLAAGWWGERDARRAVALFCLFPGSVIFSMVYAEGIALPLAAACILALERRRWLLAGLAGAFATAAEPQAAVLVLACAAAAAAHIRRTGWRPQGLLRDRAQGAWRSLLSPLLAVAGIVGVGAFLWVWTGSPLATFTTQRYGWHERTDPLALVHLVRRFTDQISFTHFNHPTINLNYPVGIAGALFLIVGLWLLASSPRRISLPAAVWTAGVAVIACTSEYVPPNPRLLITAFPAVLVYAHRLRGAGWRWFLAANTVALAGLSALTFVGVTLRP
jgi:hypothetical protein